MAGGWVMGDVDTYDGFARQIARRSGLRCLSVECARAPNTRSPRRSMTALRQSGGLPPTDRRSASTGHDWPSSEIPPAHNLAFGVSLALRDAGSQPVRVQPCCMAPIPSISTARPSATFGSGAYFLGTAEIRALCERLSARSRARQNPWRCRCWPSRQPAAALHRACEFDPLLKVIPKRA